MIVSASSLEELEGLNESPSQKEGKLVPLHATGGDTGSLNESPSQKEGKYTPALSNRRQRSRLNESPSQKEGKSVPGVDLAGG